VQAQESVELKWKLEAGDRFSVESSAETVQEHDETEDRAETKRTFTLSAVMEVAEAAGGEARVELRILRTDGKQRIQDVIDAEEIGLGTEAREPGGNSASAPATRLTPPPSDSRLTVQGCPAEFRERDVRKEGPHRGDPDPE
jgi:hypothetical protein